MTDQRDQASDASECAARPGGVVTVIAARQNTVSDQWSGTSYDHTALT